MHYMKWRKIFWILLSRVHCFSNVRALLREIKVKYWANKNLTSQSIPIFHCGKQLSCTHRQLVEIGMGKSDRNFGDNYYFHFVIFDKSFLSTRKRPRVFTLVPVALYRRYTHHIRELKQALWSTMSETHVCHGYTRELILKFKNILAASLFE